MSHGQIVVVLGTRPEIIKLAPIIRAMESPPLIVHTGQHYDDDMAGVFFDAFGIPHPEVDLAVGGQTRGQQIGNAIRALDEFLDVNPAAAVVVQGDTNSTLAASVAANARSVPLVHVEAGLRSHDRDMPEEHNRVLTDHLADLCLAPTGVSAANLESEGIDKTRVRITGNTVVDAVEHLCPQAQARASIRARYGLEKEGYVLSTFHRPENVDRPDRLEAIIDQLAAIGLPVLLPLHPRTRRTAESAGIALGSDVIRVIEPIGYVEFLGLLADCALTVADSGGVQEEVSVLKRPMVVVRKSTERPEVLGTFCTLVEAGPDISTSAAAWLSGHPYSLEDLATTESPYGDGRSAERCVSEIDDLLRSRS